MSDPGTVINIVGSDDAPGKLHKEKILFIGGTCATQKSKGIGAMLVFDFSQIFSRKFNSFLSGDFLKIPILLNQGISQPLFTVNKFMGVPSLNAQPSLTYRVGL